MYHKDHAFFYKENKEIKKFKRENEGKKIIAYGHGSYYQKVSKYLIKHGVLFEDILVSRNNEIFSINSNKIKKIKKDEMIIICSSFYFEIFEFLVGKGVPSNSIKIAHEERLDKKLSILCQYRKRIISQVYFLFLRFYIGRLCIFFLKKKRYIYIKSIWLDKYPNRINLELSSKYDVASPKYENYQQLIKRDLPNINLYFFRNGFLSPESSSVLAKEALYIERVSGVSQKKANYIGGPLLWHNKSRAIVDITHQASFEQKVLFLGGNGSSNYYHWLIEILPKLFYLLRHTDCKIETLVVSEALKRLKNFSEALRLILNDFNIAVIYLKAGMLYEFKEVFYLTTFNNVIFNKDNDKSSVFDCYFHQKILENYVGYLKATEGYRCLIENRCLIEKSQTKKFPKKIFLLRGAVSSFNFRSYNELETLAYFEKFGFIGIKVESYSFIEQIFLFSEATHIIGPSGAFWANIIFCQRGAKSISWLVENVRDFSVYSTLAHLFGVEMIFTNCKSLTSYLHGPYILNLDSFDGVSSYYK